MPSDPILLYATQLLETGGIESHVKEFCAAMQSDGHIIDLLCPNFALSADDEDELRKMCRSLVVLRKGRSLYRHLWLFSNLMRLRFAGYSAIYTNGQGNSLLWIKRFMSASSKWVHHHHTAGDAEDRLTWTGQYKETLLAADVLIACSGRSAKDMTNYLGRQVETIPCFSRRVRVAAKTSLGESVNGNLRLGYFGRLIPEKGIDTLIALGNDPDLTGVEFHIWGEGPRYPASFFEGLRNIKYHGTFKGRDQLSQVIGSIEGFLLLSVHPEGLPISLLEVMSAGLPWLATDRGGIPDIAPDPVSTRVIPFQSDYSQIKSEVARFVADIRAGKMSSSSQMDQYEKIFAAEALAKRWAGILVASSV